MICQTWWYNGWKCKSVSWKQGSCHCYLKFFMLIAEVNFPQSWFAVGKDGCNLNATLHIFYGVLVFSHRNLSRFDLNRKKSHYKALLRPWDCAFRSFWGTYSVHFLRKTWPNFATDFSILIDALQLPVDWSSINPTIFVSSDGMKLSFSLLKLIVSLLSDFQLLFVYRTHFLKDKICSAIFSKIDIFSKLFFLVF